MLDSQLLPGIFDTPLSTVNALVPSFIRRLKAQVRAMGLGFEVAWIGGCGLDFVEWLLCFETTNRLKPPASLRNPSPGRLWPHPPCAVAPSAWACVRAVLVTCTRFCKGFTMRGSRCNQLVQIVLMQLEASPLTSDESLHLAETLVKQGSPLSSNSEFPPMNLKLAEATALPSRAKTL